jgi:uncharacterized protein (TIGR02186 family)
MSEYRIAIDSDFSGKRMLLFGARNDPGHLVIVVRGPERDVTIRKKSRVFGVWVNSQQLTLRDVPSYYAITGSRKLGELGPSPLYPSLEIGLPSIDLTGYGVDTPQDRQAFVDAFFQLQTENNLYSDFQRPVSFMGSTLFKTALYFPDNLPRGEYAVDIYLLEDGILRSMQTLPLVVDKVGFDAFIYRLAHEHAFLYGLLAIMIAVGAGWLVSYLFSRLW